MMLQGVGDLNTACGPNPCGLWDSLFPSAACNTWQVCAGVANQSQPPASQGCIVGGVDAYGDTIVSCGMQDPTESPYPVVTSAACTGMTPEQCAAITTVIPGLGSVGIPQWALLGGVVFVIAMLASRR